MRAFSLNLENAVVGSMIALPVLLLIVSGVGLSDPQPNAAASASGEETSDYADAQPGIRLPGAGPADAPTDGAPHYDEYEAWHADDEYDYFDFGSNTRLDGERIAFAPVWAFIEGFDENGEPRFIADHASLFDVVPGQQGYSDLWDVQFVIVPPGYESSRIHSLAELTASGLEIVPGNMLVNCPIVPVGSSIEDGRALKHGWSRGEPVVYYHFGVTSERPMRTWVPITGFDGDGRPVLVSGQYPVIEFAPGEPGYSQFQQLYYVTVDDEYEADELRSAEDVAASGYGVTPTRIVLNRPVLETD